MNKGIKFLSILFFCANLSCTKSSMNRSDYLEYVQDEKSGLIKQIEIGELSYTIYYRPLELIALQENDTLTEASKKSRVNELSGTLNFVIKIKVKSGSINPLKYQLKSMQEYNDRNSYYLNEAKQDIHLTYGDILLNPIYYSFETNYGLTPEDAMIVQFKLPNNETTINHDLILTYYDRVFQNGIIKSTTNKNKLLTIPTLNL